MNPTGEYREKGTTVIPHTVRFIRLILKNTEKYITPNSANREYALKKLKEMKNVFTAPIIKKDILEYTLCLTKFNKITETVTM